MRRRQEFTAPSEELELTPMIDIVFNLLIFFMCATKFRTPEGLIEAFLPKDKGDGPSPQAQQDVTTVRVKLLWTDAAGQPTQGDRGHVVLKIGEHVLNDPGALRAGEAPRRAAYGALYEQLVALKADYKGSNTQGLPVILDVRQQVPTEDAVAALNEVVRAGISDVTFAAPERAY